MEWTDKKNRIAVTALHKRGIKRALTFELLNPLNITCVFVYLTVKLFLDMGGVSDHKRSGWPRKDCTPQVIEAVRSRINQNPVRKQKNYGLGNGYCTNINIKGKPGKVK